MVDPAEKAAEILGRQLKRSEKRSPVSRAPHMFCPSLHEFPYSLSVINVLDSFSGGMQETVYFVR